MRPPTSACLALGLLTNLLVAPAVALGAEATMEAVDLTNLSLDELTEVEVSIVSRRQERADQAAAAVTVISNEDLRRSGVTALPTAFRMAPGLHVGRISSSAWAVSSRGFGSLNSSKLLVLMDGRSVYTPLFSGVIWDVQDTLLEDVDRIEIVRGPGASVWGAGAMNGVINVLTRSAKQSQGTYLEAGGGTHEQGFLGLRQGGQLASGVYYRVFAKGFQRAAGYGAPEGSDDSWRMGRLGLRVDADISDEDSLTVTADGYLGRTGLVRPSLTLTGHPPPTGRLQADLAGGNVLARWTHRFGQSGDLSLRTYYDRTHRDDPTFQDDLDTLDVDLQSRIELPWQQLMWGLSYRLMNNHFRERGIIDIRPPRSRDHLVSGFLQDTLSLVEDSLRLTLGSKFEHNDFSGFEVEPSLRVAFDPGPRHTIWAAVSRATRVPTRFERDLFSDVNVPPMPYINVLGARDLNSEKLLAAELGYRLQPTDRLSFDQSVYYHRYTELITFEFDPPFVNGMPPPAPWTLTYKNQMHGKAFGGELVASFEPNDHLTVQGSYSYVRVELVAEGMDVNRNKAQERAAPRHQAFLRSSADLPADLALSGALRWVSALKVGDMPGEQVDGYLSADARLAWRGWKPFELSVVGQHLVARHHREFPSGTEVSRSVYGKVAAWF